jgi:hypothetical protein
VAGLHPLQQGQRERGGLAGARAGLAQAVTFRERRWNQLTLNVSRRLESDPFHCRK